jgi:PAS domain S-box-containing protein
MLTTTLSLADYQIVVEQAPIMIWRSNIDGKCDFFNDRWLAFTGRALDEELGDGWSAGVHADDLQHCLSTYRTAFERRESFEMEYRLRRYDGEYRWVLDRGAPVTDASGAFAGYIGSCIDVTDRVTARAALARDHLIGLTVLSGLLPMCAWCRRVRDLDDSWVTLEAYLHQHTDARFSHGLCPECERTHQDTWE